MINICINPRVTHHHCRGHNMFKILIKIATQLDNQKMHKEADIVDKVIQRLAQFSGPYSINMPIGSGIDGTPDGSGVRVIPWKDMEEEFNDTENGHAGSDSYSRGGRRNFPRFDNNNFPLKGDAEGVEEAKGSEFSMNAGAPMGVAHMEYSNEPGMRGSASNVTKDYEYNRLRGPNSFDWAKYTPMH